MKINSSIKTVLLLAIVLFYQCSKDSPAPRPEPTPTPEPVVILQPTAAVLSFPTNDEPCLDTTTVNEDQSTVVFRWNAGEHVSSYELTLTNLAENNSQRYTSSGTELSLTLIHSEPYSWKVTSLGETGSNPAESATWRFYLAGPAEDNYAPFPAELTTPVSGSTVTPIDSNIQIQWICSDVDNDLATYQIYLDTEDATTLVQSVAHEASTTAVDVTVENNTIYYWKIVAVDAQGNESSSGVYSFRTN